MNVQIRKLGKEEIGDALDLVRSVFMEYEAPDYSREGIDEFEETLKDETFLSRLEWHGAYAEDKLAGVIAMRDEGRHIALFFVKGDFQGQGIGRVLFEEVRKEGMTVNSSPYAVQIYRKLGFEETDGMQEVNGIRFLPMKLK